MPLVVICGQPCSGKSTLAAQIANAFRQRGHEVVVLDEESLHLTRNASYQDVRGEKNTRSLLRSAVDRSVGRSCVVVFDSLNNIKGYRYELWCVARSVATRYCMVHVDAPVESCRQWNAARAAAGGDTYSEAVFDDLAGRFERPDARNRWDAPLFTVNSRMSQGQVEEQVGAIVAAATQAPGTAHAVAAAAGVATSLPAGQQLTPTCATNNPSLASTNLLYELDKAAQGVVDRVSQAQEAAMGAAPGAITFGNEMPTLLMHRQMPLPELRRHKRSFMRMATNNSFNRVENVQTAQRMFIDFLRSQLEAGAS